MEQNRIRQIELRSLIKLGNRRSRRFKKLVKEAMPLHEYRIPRQRMSIKDGYPKMTELERACKLLDELLCLMGSTGRTLDLHCQREAMEMIAAARKNNPDYPITLWLLDRLEEWKLLPGPGNDATGSSSSIG